MKLRELRWRAAGHYSQPLDERFIEPLNDAEAIEVGGPSALFRSGGLLPVYPVLTRLDGLQLADAHELWHGEMREGDFDPGEPELSGRLRLGEGGDLSFAPAGTYDAVLASHVVEHLANPIGALREWLRVLKPSGHLLVVLPHKEGCADHRRPTTTLAHLVEDETRATPEHDMTHADEVIALHDIARDPLARDPETLRLRALDNPANRAMHHHVFTTRSALRLLDHMNLHPINVETRWPHDIYVLARRLRSGHAFTNERHSLSAEAASLRGSPFRLDRREASGYRYAEGRRTQRSGDTRKQCSYRSIADVQESLAWGSRGYFIPMVALCTQVTCA